MAADSGLPSGTVTFLFTDIEGSTDLLKQLGRDRYESVLAEQAGVLRAAVAAHGGQVVDTQGDSLFCAFRSAREGVSAAIEAQRELASHEWPEQRRVRVRMGLHSGEPKTGEDRYVGIGVHRAARIGAAAHGGQILVSETARALVSDDLPAGVSLRDLGVHRLKDIDEPVRLYQLVAAGLEDRFPPPKTMPKGRSRRVRVGLLVAGLAIGAAVAGVLLTTGSASAKPVRLSANSIAVIDPKSGKAVGDVPVSFSPTDVDAGGDRIWVLNGSAQTATSIDPNTLRVVGTVGVDGNPTSQYASGATEWVGIPGGVDEVSGDGATPIRLWPTPTGYQETCYTFVTGDGKSVWVSEGQDVAVLDAASGSVLRKLTLAPAQGYPPGVTCYGLRYGDGRLLAIRNVDYSIGTVDLGSRSYTPTAVDGTNIYTQTFASSGWAPGFGYDWISTWTTVSTNNIHQVSLLKRLNPVSGQIMSQTVLGATGGSVAVDPASGVWVFAGRTRATRLAHVDPESGDITGSVLIGHGQGSSNGEVGSAIAAGHGRLWVAIGSP